MGCVRELSARASVSTRAPANRRRIIKSWAQVTGGRLEIKTSGRYTYEMGRALFASKNTADQALWRDWYTLHPRARAARLRYSTDATEQKDGARLRDRCAREVRPRATDVFASAGRRRAPRWKRSAPVPEHMFWFEYNFLHVLAAGGRAVKKPRSATTRPPATSSARVSTRSATRAASISRSNIADVHRVPRREHRSRLRTRRAPPREQAARRLHVSLDAMLNDISKVRSNDAPLKSPESHQLVF